MKCAKADCAAPVLPRPRLAPVAIKRLKDQSPEQQVQFLKEMAILRACRGSRYVVNFVGASLLPVRAASSSAADGLGAEPCHPPGMHAWVPSAEPPTNVSWFGHLAGKVTSVNHSFDSGAPWSARQYTHSRETSLSTRQHVW